MHSKKFYPTICLSQIFFTPPKETNRTRFLLCLDMVYAFTLPLCSKIILLPHLTLLIFFSYPIILSSAPTPVINNGHSLRPLPWKIPSCVPDEVFIVLCARILSGASLSKFEVLALELICGGLTFPKGGDIEDIR